MNNSKEEAALQQASRELARRVRRIEQFLLAFRGVPAHRLTRALNKLTPGVNWAGCTKNMLALDWGNR